MSEQDGRRPQTEPPVADRVDEADPEAMEALTRDTGPTAGGQPGERTGGVGGTDRASRRQVPGGEESAET
jgi:hypothetical protein